MKRISKSPLRRRKAAPLRTKRVIEVEVSIDRELQCSRCKATFPDYLARCPECGSDEWVGLAEVNPYTRMPMETFLKSCGHLLWLMGTVGFLWLLWQTGNTSPEETSLYVCGAILLLFCSVLFSGAYFGMSEIMRRILRVQRRLRAFHQNYRDSQPGSPSSILAQKHKQPYARIEPSRPIRHRKRMS